MICYTCHDEITKSVKYTNSRNDTYDYCSNYCADLEHYAQCDIDIMNCQKCINILNGTAKRVILN